VFSPTPWITIDLEQQWNNLAATPKNSVYPSLSRELDAAVIGALMSKNLDVDSVVIVASVLTYLFNDYKVGDYFCAQSYASGCRSDWRTLDEYEKHTEQVLELANDYSHNELIHYFLGAEDSGNRDISFVGRDQVLSAAKIEIINSTLCLDRFMDSSMKKGNISPATIWSFFEGGSACREKGFDNANDLSSHIALAKLAGSCDAQ
jgi:hypothetical protein